MIHVLHIIICFGICAHAFAQSPKIIAVRKDTSASDSLTTVVFTGDASQVQPPSFPGGMNELKLFIGQNVEFPEVYLNDSTFKSCTVYVKFMVNPDGSLSDTQIQKGCQGFDKCDKEALRVMKLMPAWNPAMQNGKAIKRPYCLPIKFKKQ